MTKRNWSLNQARKIFSLPFNDLIYKAQTIHRRNFRKNEIQISTLLSIKTGKCPEDCKYCPQSAHYNTELESQKLMLVEEVLNAAKKAKAMNSSRFCIGAAWRGLHGRDLPIVCKMITEIKKLDLEVCGTFGLLSQEQAMTLKQAGLDFYNHNIDTSEEFYKNIVATRNFEDRLKTIQNVRNGGIKVCAGGILGMGETNDDRIKMLLILANLDPAPESVPINKLIKIPGTPLENEKEVDFFDFVRTIALARIMMPASYVRLSAGREQMSEVLQALCFFAGANSIFYGEKLLTADNPAPEKDKMLFEKLGLKRLQKK